MTHRLPRLKNQAKLVRAYMAERGLAVGSGESLELIARMSGYPSWNVANQNDPEPGAGEPPTTVTLKIWTAVHHHRHGEDVFLFLHHPSTEQVIERVQATSSWEPEENESIEVLGVEEFNIDMSLELAKKAASLAPSVLGALEVNMADRFEYTVPQELFEWRWIQENSSFSHNENGREGGVWEFMVHRRKFVDEDTGALSTLLPIGLVDDLTKAQALGAVWVLFHQG